MKYGFYFLLFTLAACATSMSPQEFVQANVNCEQANERLEAQVACMDDFLLTRNADSADYDVYYTWVKERNAIMEQYASGELSQVQAKLALLNAQNKYESILLNRDMRDIAVMNAIERRRPMTCHSYRAGSDVRTICD